MVVTAQIEKQLEPLFQFDTKAAPHLALYKVKGLLDTLLNAYSCLWEKHICALLGYYLIYNQKHSADNARVSILRVESPTHKIYL